MSAQLDWNAINERHLASAVKWARLRLQQLAPAETDHEKKGGLFGRGKDARATTNDAVNLELGELRQDLDKLEKNTPPPALRHLADVLGLSAFERNVLILCAAVELDTRVAALCAQAQDNPNKPYPTFALAFALFDDPDWNALAPHRPLRYWRLLEINQTATQPLTASALTIDERILNYLKGLDYLDDRLLPLMDPIIAAAPDAPLPPSQQQVADYLIQQIHAANGKARIPFAELLGADPASKQAVAMKVAAAFGLSLQLLGLHNLRAQSGDFESFCRLWQRESLLMPLALYVRADAAEKQLLQRLLERSGGMVFVDSNDANAEALRTRISVDVGKPLPEEQRQLWTDALAEQAGDMPQCLSEQFSFNQDQIKRLAATVLTGASAEPGKPLRDDLWQACRIAARAGMEQLASRIDAKADWEQLVLPPEQIALLRQITGQVASRNRVYDAWGFRERMNRGMGISALFAGESGTGKTMAAEVIANALQLDLFRIDLSAVVNKYIGETEKNLRKLFDAAEDSGAILFFDEADALFGKRSEVKDSHDRYANIEINYLLQRMEAYRGLAILATNMKNTLDKAFVRRLRFIVDFPFPGVEERKQIWQKVFPPAAPLGPALDYQRLAALNLTGGNIHNVALNAAFLAAQQENGRITMPLLLNAARNEFKKLDRPAKESEFRWLDAQEA